MKKDYIMYRIKKMRIIRVVLFAFVNKKREINTKQYIERGRGKNIQRLKNIHLGKRCFIIGNGPSLLVSDLERLHNEITFASNRIYRIYNKTEWRPDYYVAFEPEFVKGNIDEIIKIPVKKGRLINNIGYRDGADHITYWINCTSQFCINKETTKSVKFSEDISRYVGDGYSVVFTIIQIAIYMGFKEIYLIGMDHNYNDDFTSHFYNDKTDDYQTPTFWKGIEYAYQLSKTYADNHGISIINITRGGNLEVFPRSSVEEVL